MKKEANRPLRLLLVACKVLQREVYLCASRSPNIIDVVFLPQGLHDEPDKLRSELAPRIAESSDPGGKPYDAVLLGYGLCSNGIAGLEASVTTVVPRCHDCIGILLGSKETYREYFDSHRGIYWYSAGWIEHGLQPGKERFELTRRRYAEQYGPENADFLMQQMENWMREYRWATYIDWGLPNSEYYRRYTKECAAFMGWSYDEVPGSPRLLQDLLDGVWDPDRFLVLEPGRKIAPDVNSPGIIRSE